MQIILKYVKQNYLTSRNESVIITSVKKKSLHLRFCFECSATLCERGMTVSKNLDVSVLFDYYGDMLTEKQRDVIDLYYNQDLSLAEIAEHEKITRQGVRDNIKRGEAYMAELEEALHVAEQSQRLIALLEDIQARNKEIALINDNHKYSAVIREHTAQINGQIDAFLKDYE